MNDPGNDGLPKRRYMLWLRMLALVLALALGAWFIDILITVLLHSAAH